MPIEMLREEEHSWTKGVEFRWQGMTFYLAVMPYTEGKKFLTFAPANAQAVRAELSGPMASWTISEAEESSQDAGASTKSAETCSGSAATAIGENTIGK